MTSFPSYPETNGAGTGALKIRDMYSKHGKTPVNANNNSMFPLVTQGCHHFKTILKAVCSL